MRDLWREAGIAALVCGALTGCASPAYPVSEGQTPGPAPLTMAKPAYPTSDSATPAQRPQAPVAESDDAAPSGPPLAAPVAPVESQSLSAPAAPVQTQSLPAPGPSASSLDEQFSGGARLQYVSLSNQATPAVTTTASPPTSTPMATASPAAAPTTTTTPPPTPGAPPTVAPAPTPAATPATPAPAPVAEPAMTPRMVVHDQPMSPATRQPPVRQAVITTAAPVRQSAPDDPNFTIAGDVVDASGGVFENYEVQRGDHIDALARAFSTTRKVLLDANDVRAPFLLRPGQILKVPVAKAYVARSGDTLPGVAKRFAVGIDELAQLNHLSARGSLRPGQEIGLPSSMRDRGPIRLAGSESAYAEAAAPAYRTEPPPPTTTVRHYGQIAPAQPSESQAYQTSQPPAYTAQAGPSFSDSDIAQAAHGRFVWPVRGDMLTRFGPQGVGRRNDGIDIRAAQGTVVKAAAQGEVVYAGNLVPGFGNLVLIKHTDGWVTAYAHLDTVDVQMKQHVSQGQSIGSVGVTGGATEPELHFEVRYAPTPADKARPVDPVLVLPLG